MRRMLGGSGSGVVGWARGALIGDNGAERHRRNTRRSACRPCWPNRPPSHQLRCFPPSRRRRRMARHQSRARGKCPLSFQGPIGQARPEKPRGRTAIRAAPPCCPCLVPCAFPLPRHQRQGLEKRRALPAGWLGAVGLLFRPTFFRVRGRRGDRGVWGGGQRPIGFSPSSPTPRSQPHRRAAPGLPRLRALPPPFPSRIASRR